MRFSLSLYNIAAHAGIFIGLPLILPYLLLRAKRRQTVWQRFGLTHLPGPAIGSTGGTVWIHAMSVGEVTSSIPLLRALKEAYPHQVFGFSASTRTGIETALRECSGLADAVFYFPYDLPFSIRRFNRRILPRLIIIVETDIWPNFLFEMHQRRIPLILANARISDRSFAAYRRSKRLAGLLLSNFAEIGVQSEQDRLRFEQLGVPAAKICLTGNIKFDQTVKTPTSVEIAELRRSLTIQPAQPILVAGSTHDGEEIILGKALVAIKRRFPDLVLIVAPRNPLRTETIGKILRTTKLQTQTLTEICNRPSTAPVKPEIILIDRFGVLKRLYGIADIALIGGSLLAIRGIGGHNPLEPAALAKPILFGPHMKNFRDISQRLLAARAAIQVTDSHSLAATVIDLLQNQEQAQQMGFQALAVFNRNKGAVTRTLDLIKAYL
jgi:3-deoxy-D-manno-octulosonic-acid transferase